MRYKKDLANSILTQISKDFQHFNVNITYEMYVESVQKIFRGKTTEKLTEFAFKLFDAHKDDHICEKDMFSLLSQVTEIKYHDKPLQLDRFKKMHRQKEMDGSRPTSSADDEPSKGMRFGKGQVDDLPTTMVLLNDVKKPNVIIPLTEKKEDLFIDVFKDDYIKIMKQMQEKKEKLKINDDDIGKARREALAAGKSGIKIPHIGSKNRGSFGASKTRNSSNISEASVDNEDTMTSSKAPGGTSKKIPSGVGHPFNKSPILEGSVSDATGNVYTAFQFLSMLKKDDQKQIFLTKTEFLKLF